MCQKGFKGYLLEGDKEIIARWANDKNISISFRPAGKDTLKCLARGAGAKPHEILDKTLKLKKVPAVNSDKTQEQNDAAINSAKNHNAAVGEFFANFPATVERKDVEDLLMGLVGHWTKIKVGEDRYQDKVDGLYLTELGKATFNGWTTRANAEGMPYLVLENPEQKSALMTYYQRKQKEDDKKALYRFTRLFFSGDYDIHDMLQVGYPVPTEIDKQLLAELQQELLAGRRTQLKASFGLSEEDLNEEIVTEKDSRRDSRNDYRRVQHGPQFNYTAQMLNENFQYKDEGKLNILVNSVMDMDTPVLIYDKVTYPQKWEVLKDYCAVAGYYEKKGRTLKDTWKSQDARNHYIKWVICEAIYLCFGRSVDPGKVIFLDFKEKVPGFVKVYGEKQFKSYFEEAVKEMSGTR